MRDNPYLNHVEESVTSAHPVELVALLFDALRGSIRQGRLALANGEIAARSNALSRCLEILAELAISVDKERGGELATGMVALYAFAAEQIQRGNYLQSDAPLADAERVLQPIIEAWQVLAADVRAAERRSMSGQAERVGESAQLSLCG